MAGEYTVAVVVASIAVVGLELLVLRTGLFREVRYWATMAIVVGFQVPVDGWLTHRAAPVVSYSDAATSGIRFPADIPIEDFAFGFALVTLTLLLWRRAQPRDSGARAGGGDG
jgi:lycopene cyclase domain-containing protein